MFRNFLIWLTDKLTDLFIIIGIDRLAAVIWDWNYELTQPDRDRKIREAIRRALKED